MFGRWITVQHVPVLLALFPEGHEGHEGQEGGPHEEGHEVHEEEEVSVLSSMTMDHG